MRYVVSCERCKFLADATDIRGLGSQMNVHASTCNLAPLLVLVEDDSEHPESAITAPDDQHYSKGAVSSTVTYSF